VAGGNKNVAKTRHHAQSAHSPIACAYPGHAYAFTYLGCLAANSHRVKAFCAAISTGHIAI